MKKNYYFTQDIFLMNGGDADKKLFAACHKWASKSGLVCKAYISTQTGWRRLDMTGSKSNFLKYYLMVICHDKPRVRDLKRLAEVFLLK